MVLPGLGSTLAAATLPYQPRCAIDAVTAKLITELIKHSLEWVTGLLHKTEVMPDSVNMANVMAMGMLGTREKPTFIVSVCLFCFLFAKRSCCFLNTDTSVDVGHSQSWQEQLREHQERTNIRTGGCEERYGVMSGHTLTAVYISS